MKILITGGAGFLGSYLCEYFIKLGHFVICVDNFISGDFLNISHLMDNARFSFIEADICNNLDVECDYIFNLACPASPVIYQNNPIFTFKTNVFGSINLLELAKRNNARIFQASTSEIYGNPGVHPQPESYFGNVNSIGVRGCYNEGKRSAETLFYDFFRQFKVDIRVARIFNTYGPRMSSVDGRIISNFICQALKGDDVTVYGDGSHTRSFAFVDDIVDGIVKLMESDFCYPVNLGNPEEFSINEIADIIIKKTNSNSNIVYKELPEDDPLRRKPDISLAKKIIDWEPKISFNNGLDKTIECFRKRF
ncbi:MAG: SDR family oxidoreductase [Candidatus Muirbacterium halophilum]|nr:SDR family oxidoreductase [Candidatus Muirbacterium halophilum]MCK9476399.1 SDR family oxidoreductase [Candidatus Muirbacterium halophilum]